jgi:hypothetical protein
VLLLILLPLEQWRFPMNLKPADVALVSLTAYSFWRAGQRGQRLDFPLIIPIWVILISSLIATLVGLGQSDSAIAIAQEVYIFAWFLALANVLKTFSFADTDRLMKMWGVVACLESVTTVMGMARIGPSMFYRAGYEPVTGDLVRATGTYDNSNAVAVYLSVSLFILLATSWPIWLRSVLGLWLLVGILATGSNGALLTTIGGLAVLGAGFLLLKNRRDAALTIALTGIGVGVSAAVVVALGPALLHFLGPGFETNSPLLYNTLGRLSHSVNRRLGIISWGWATYKQHPLGTGPNSFGSGLHNDYVAFLFERGPFGLIGWLWLIGSTIAQSLRSASRLAENSRGWRILLMGAGILGCAVNAASHEISHMRQVWLLMVFLFALSYGGLSQQASSHSSGWTGPVEKRR